MTWPAGQAGCSACSQHLHSRCSVPPFSQHLWCRCAVPPTLSICSAGGTRAPALGVCSKAANCSSSSPFCSTGVHPHPLSPAQLSIHSPCVQCRCPSTAHICSRGCTTASAVTVGSAVTLWCLPWRPAGQVLQSSFGRLRAKLEEKLDRVCFLPVHHFRARPHNSTWWGIT